MTHGRNEKSRVNRRSEKSSSLLTRFSKDRVEALEGRVAKLETRIEQMQQEIDRASGTMPAQFYESIYGARKRPGPEKRIDDTELLLNRDNLIQWLENYWPTVVKRLLAARTPRQIADILKPVAAEREIRPSWQKCVIAHPAKLLEFLRSDKFRIRPPRKTVADALDLHRSDKRQKAANRLPTRQIANAMAGVPKLKWRSSLDKCSSNPSSLAIGYETARHYQAMFGISDGQV